MDTSDITISDTSNIEDVTVTLNGLSHTWAGDLTATLTHVDTGTSVDLFNRPGVPASTFGNNTDLTGNFSFNDSFTGDFIADAAANDGGTLSGGNFFATADDDSQTFLSAFNGESASGTWTLAITDNAGGDTGSLGSWDLELETASTPEFSPVLGILLIGASFGLKRGRDRYYKKQNEIDLTHILHAFQKN